ncbi:MAG: bis-aminopropyl spermidine synthase family protein [Syntrophales bacterium]|jgi:predicted methyltransferase|nr:bis-aminopropyl spermidine synthase family protein [Syntrophales bacterium]
MALDLREALNTISDVVQNRPSPLREFDQIYMKVGDLVIQSEFIARKFDGLDIVFIGDGDAISLCTVHLRQKEIFRYGPHHITVLDFDERIVKAVNHFAYNNDLGDKIEAVLYNVCDPLPECYWRTSDAFYTNPPWGASNDGKSVTAFVQRGIEAAKPKGMGAVVIGDNEEVEWTGQVLFRTQEMLINAGFIISEMIPGLHKYHLDDSPELTSCCMVARDINAQISYPKSEPLPSAVLDNFYGRNSPLKVRYVKDRSGLNLGRAHDSSYELIPLEGNQ